MYISEVNMEIIMEVPQKLEIELPYDPSVPFLDKVFEENENINSKMKNLYVHCSIIRNSQDMETTQEIAHQ